MEEGESRPVEASNPSESPASGAPASHSSSKVNPFSAESFTSKEGDPITKAKEFVLGLLSLDPEVQRNAESSDLMAMADKELLVLKLDKIFAGKPLAEALRSAGHRKSKPEARLIDAMAEDSFRLHEKEPSTAMAKAIASRAAWELYSSVKVRHQTRSRTVSASEASRKLSEMFSSMAGAAASGVVPEGGTSVEWAGVGPKVSPGNDDLITVRMKGWDGSDATFYERYSPQARMVKIQQADDLYQILNTNATPRAWDLQEAYNYLADNFDAAAKQIGGSHEWSKLNPLVDMDEMGVPIQNMELKHFIKVNDMPGHPLKGAVETFRYYRTLAANWKDGLKNLFSDNIKGLNSQDNFDAGVEALFPSGKTLKPNVKKSVDDMKMSFDLMKYIPGVTFGNVLEDYGITHSGSVKSWAEAFDLIANQDTSGRRNGTYMPNLVKKRMSNGQDKFFIGGIREVLNVALNTIDRQTFQKRALAVVKQRVKDIEDPYTKGVVDDYIQHQVLGRPGDTDVGTLRLMQKKAKSMSEWVKTNPNSKFLSMVRRISGVSNADIQNAFDSGLGFGMRVAGQKPATTAANAVMALGSAAKIGGSTGTFLAGLMGSFVKKGPTALRGAMRLLTRAAKNDPDYLRELAANRVVNSSWEDMSGLSKDSSVSGALEMLGEYRGSDVIRKLAGVHSSVSKAWFSNAWGPDAAFRLMLWSDEYYRLRDSGMDSKRAGYFAKKQTDVWIDMVDDVGTPMIIGTRLPIIGKILTQFKSSGLKSSQYIADVIVRGSTPDRLELATGMALTYSMFALAFGANPLGKIMSMPVPMLGEVMRGETPPVVDFLSDLANGELNSAFARQFEDTSDDESIARVMGARFPRSTGNPLMDIQSSVIKSTFDPKDQERAAERFASKPVYEEIHDTTRLKRKLRAKNRRIEELEGGL